MEVVDIDLDNIPLSNEAPAINIEEKPSVSFGGGIELLMNEKKKSSNASTKLDLDELDNLESELNDLSNTSTPAPQNGGSKTLNGLSGFGNMFGFGGSSSKPQSSSSNEEPSLGQATKDTGPPRSSTWDGFSKVTEDIPKQEPRSSANMTEREKRRKKRLMIKKLEEWAEKGTYKHGSSFNMDSNYDEVEDEYEGAMEEKRKKDSVKLQGWWFTTVINTLEYGNAFINPFDLNLDGWGEQVSEDLDSYEEIFSELHEKYKGGKMAPEVSLLLRIGFSAAVVNMSNKMLSSATPGFNDVIKQSPELMKMFSNAAVDTMSKQNSAFDFAKNMMNPPEQVNTRPGPPPAPVKTQNSAPPARPGSMNFTAHPGNRPDLTAATNPMFRESGVDFGDSRQNYQEAPKPIPTARPEMRGPQTTPDIDQLLSGLKPKKAETPVHVPAPVQQPYVPSAPTTQPTTPTVVEEMPMQGSESIISLSSLKDLDGTTMPKKSRRRNKSDRNNTVALDI
jgi:hypothetical protein